jgi:uncharacterized protein with von Willebrand factor type A (vWA) domain
MVELEALVAFAGRLRDAGVVAGTGQVETAARALAAVDADDARDALRAVFCSRAEDLARFDAVWAQLQPAVDPQAAMALPRVVAPEGPTPLRGRPAREQGEEDAEARPAAWSAVELLRDRDLAELDDAERAAARALLARLGRRRPTRPSRRLRAARARAPRPDLQRTARAALRRGGEPVDRAWRAPGRATRPVVLVLDVSGSMAPYATMLLVYAQAMVADRRRVEAFAFGTRLTRITLELAGRDAATAVARAGGAAADWAGGTRIGASLATLNREHGRLVGRGAVVVVASDGWDRGDPEQVAAEMARLARTAHRVVWLNPLSARPGYEPLARGMAAALPHIDHFLAGHSVRSLEELARVLEEELG